MKRYGLLTLCKFVLDTFVAICNCCVVFLLRFILYSIEFGVRFVCVFLPVSRVPPPVRAMACRMTERHLRIGQSLSANDFVEEVGVLFDGCRDEVVYPPSECGLRLVEQRVCCYSGDMLPDDLQDG